MRRDKTGEYETTNASGELVRAFIPARLPPCPPLDLSGLQDPLARAHLALGRLDGRSDILPDLSYVSSITTSAKRRCCHPKSRERSRPSPI